MRILYFPCLNQNTLQLAEKNSLPKWALTSFPGSGVTWTRQLIEGVTGIYTGSMHKNDPPPVLVEGIYEARNITGRCIYILAHQLR